MKTILVTGGFGFIGSHTVVELVKNRYEVIVIDNFVNSHKDVIGKIEEITEKKVKYYEINMLDVEKLENVFQENKIDGVIHFAGLKAVGESVKKPIFYYENNIVSTLNLLKIMEKYECFNLVFSSSATVYGSNKSPLKEDDIIGQGITNPYGETKFMIERILRDLTISNNHFMITSLRYFNPIGAHPSGLIGENPNDIPNNLMPFILKVSVQNNTDFYLGEQYKYLNIFGDDYRTKDGTCLRDYIHVEDLARGHLQAIKYLKTGYSTYNLGRGEGISVLELVKTFEKVNKVKIPYKIIERRIGDLECVFCDPNKALKELKWEANKTIEEMCIDSWRYQKNNIK